MAKRTKREVVKWGGRRLRAIVNGKEVCVKKDPDNLTYYMNPPKLNGRGRDRVWLTRDIGKAAPDFWAYVEQSYQKQETEIPTNKITTYKDYSHLTPEGTLESWKNIVNADPLKVFSEFSKEIFRIKTAKTKKEIEQIKQETIAKYTPKIISMVPEEVLIGIFKEWLQDPYECSLKLGDERIANLDKLKKRDAIKLTEMGDYYFNWIPTDRDQADEDERNKVVKWWNDFIRITSNTYLDELSKADIAHYTKTIVVSAKKEGWSKTWISHRFGACRTVLNTFAKSLEDKSLPIRVVEWLKDYPAPASVNDQSDNYNPERLTKEMWLELLKLVSSKTKTRTQKEWLAIVLFAVNTCSHGVTCRNVTMLNLQGNELRMRRGKRGKVPKIAILWDETLEAIAEFRHGKMTNSQFLFPTRHGGQYSEGGFYDYWTKNIRPYLSWQFDFDQLRDTGRYGAETGNASPNAIRMVMGHRIPDGEDDAYLFRHPELAQPVADAIYNYYMR